MKYTEELLWILDKPGTTLHDKNEEYRENIEFVHSLGLKCDCVGWCKIDLANPRTPEILEGISSFCNEKGWRARGLYTRKYVDLHTDWYELDPVLFKDNTFCDRIETVTDDHKPIFTYVIRAFHEWNAAPKVWGENVFVPERFRDFCIQNKIEDLDFCWARDKGKYEAEQYFHVYGKRLITRIATGIDHKNPEHQLITAAGGWLPEIDKVFYKLQQINLQDCYLVDDLPDRGIAYAYIPSTFSCAGRYTILLHKDIAQALLTQKILPSTALKPAAVFNSLPGGYILQKTQAIDRPTCAFMSTMLSEYEKLKNTARPVRIASEKDALKMLRHAKKDRSQDFQKGLSKAKSERLVNTDYDAMMPYYRIADGCFLSDEYALLSSVMAAKENEEYQKKLFGEELLDVKPEGIVIGQCADGDVILLCKDQKVIRMSHEEPVAVEQWPTLAQFFVDTIQG